MKVVIYQKSDGLLTSNRKRKYDIAHKLVYAELFYKTVEEQLKQLNPSLAVVKEYLVVYSREQCNLSFTELMNIILLSTAGHYNC